MCEEDISLHRPVTEFTDNALAQRPQPAATVQDDEGVVVEPDLDARRIAAVPPVPSFRGRRCTTHTPESDLHGSPPWLSRNPASVEIDLRPVNIQPSVVLDSRAGPETVLILYRLAILIPGVYPILPSARVNPEGLTLLPIALISHHDWTFLGCGRKGGAEESV